MRKVSVIRAAAACGFSLAMAAVALPMMAFADDAGLAPEVIQEQADEVSSKPISIGEESYATFAEALAAGDATGARILVLNSNVEDDTFAVWPDSDITLDLRGHNVSLSAPIAVAGKLTIVDSAAGVSTPSYSDAGITYAGVGVISYNGEDHTIKVSDTAAGHQGSMGGSLTLKSGHIGGDSFGGGVLVEGGASFSMEGGVVESEDNSAVKVTQGSTFTLTEGIVYAHDYTAIMGDGYMNMGKTTINIEGGSVLSSMEVDGHVAAGVCHVQDGGTLNVSGGEIRTLSNGVGVIVDQGTFDLSGGEVYGKGSNLSGTTASGISIEQGWALLLNHVSAASSISGGFISSDAGVATVKTVESMPRARSIVDGKGVSITGGTFTNFDALKPDEGYAELGHAAEGRASWVTVMKEISISSDVAEHSVYMGQIDYYKNLDGDYPTISGRMFAGWWNRAACGEGLGNDGKHAYTDPSGQAYAEMVDEHLMQVWRQGNYNDSIGEDPSVRLYLYSTVDSLAYDEAGFRIYYDESDTTRYEDHGMDQVYTSIQYTDKDGKAKEYYPNADKNQPSGCSDAAAYFSHMQLNISSSKYENKFAVRAYWVTLDGTQVVSPASLSFKSVVETYKAM